MKDMMGNEIRAGDVILYPVGGKFGSPFIKIGLVKDDIEQLRVDGIYKTGAVITSSSKSDFITETDHVIKVSVDLESELRKLMEDNDG